MSVEVITGDEFNVEYHSGSQIVAFRGTIRFQTNDDYSQIQALMQKAEAASAGAGVPMTLDFHSLEFLNSAGINMVSKFVIAARKEDRIALVVRGNKDIYWQHKSLINLQKLWSKVSISID